MTRNFRLAVAIIATMTATIAGATTKNEVKNSAEASANATPATEIGSRNNNTIYSTTENGNRIKYVYNADDQGRVSSKVGYVLDQDTKNWMPMCAYSICYTDTETVLSYAEYDSMSKTFTGKAQQMRFDAKAYPELMKMPNK